jgi:hypothetical protein
VVKVEEYLTKKEKIMYYDEDKKSFELVKAFDGKICETSYDQKQKYHLLLEKIGEVNDLD